MSKQLNTLAARIRFLPSSPNRQDFIFLTPPPEMKLAACCILHEFYKAASKSPDKIAVIHASGGARAITRDFHSEYCTEETASVSNEEFIEPEMTSTLLSSEPPIYEGDVCFTYSEVLEAVISLSSRIRDILDGADDPQLIKRQEGNRPTRHESVHEEASESSEFSNLRSRQVTKFKDEYIPCVIGVYVEPSVDYIVSVLSVLMCGEAFLPLDPSWPKERILSLVFSSKANLILGCSYAREDKYFHQLDNLHWLIDSGCQVLSISMKSKFLNQSKLPDVRWSCENGKSRLFCYLMQTSGSTGKPKSVCGTEPGLLNRFLWMQEEYPLYGTEYLLFKTSISFIDHLQEFLGALLTSCTLVIPPFKMLKENLFFVVDFLQRYSINRLVAVPSLMKQVLPALQIPKYRQVQSSLKLLILSGEVLHLSLCLKLRKLLPNTAVLNLYGSTEVSGDCTYFDCKQLPLILENGTLDSVPIGLPISNCNVELVGGNAPNQGEIYVRGLCVAAGYFEYPFISPLESAEVHEDSVHCLGSDHLLVCGYKTGDIARQLQTGDLVFLQREDRIIKINGQRIALEEIENVLREHPAIIDAAVVCKRINEDISHIEAHLVLNQKEECNQTFVSLLRRWIGNKLPEVMIPSHIFSIASLPVSSSGKIDYNWLASSSLSLSQEGNKGGEPWDGDLLKKIAKAFQESLMVEKISLHDNFFQMGGDSLSAANVSHKLNINMKLLYDFPTVLKLQKAIQKENSSSNSNLKIDVNLRAELGATDGSIMPVGSIIVGDYNREPRQRSCGSFDDLTCSNPIKILKTVSSSCGDSKHGRPKYESMWAPDSLHTACSFTRCNRTVHAGKCEGKRSTVCCLKIPGEGQGSMEETWKVHMESCVDASPMVVFKETKTFIFIGAHSKKFVCIDAKSGFVLWEVKLEGRIECSAAILDDFSQVVVGCYQGYIYFLDVSDGSIRWKFKTLGEVKSQPVVDKHRHLVWCGSYDHHIYALDYRNYCCTCRLSCGGSIFGSPALDEVNEILFVASTSGLLTAISLKAMSFRKLWIQDLQVPVFGSLSITPNRNVICCLVNGSVVALDTAGSVIWKSTTGGPLFSGPCISNSLPFQVLVCCRDGSIYSFELEKGGLLWHHAVGFPITSSAYVDDNMALSTDISYLSERLVCVCTSNGSIIVLRVMSNSSEGTSPCGEIKVQEYARLDLEGDIFSSPVMIGGRIFVGCRDDYVYCVKICTAED